MQFIHTVTWTNFFYNGWYNCPNINAYVYLRKKKLKKQKPLQSLKTVCQGQ